MLPPSLNYGRRQVMTTKTIMAAFIRKYALISRSARISALSSPRAPSPAPPLFCLSRLERLLELRRQRYARRWRYINFPFCLQCCVRCTSGPAACLRISCCAFSCSTRSKSPSRSIFRSPLRHSSLHLLLAPPPCLPVSSLPSLSPLSRSLLICLFCPHA